MFSSSLRASLIAFVASAIAVSAAPAVSGTPAVTVKASTSNVHVDGLRDLKVTTTIVNNGGEPLKLLKDPRGTLNPFPANSFTITNPSGSQPSFNGARVKYNPEYAAGLDDPNAYIVLIAGGSYDVVHDLSAAYDFTQPGAGDYTIKPSNLFTYVGADGVPKNFYATVEDSAKVKLSGDLAITRTHKKREVFADCSSTQESDLKLAASNAQDYASNAASYLADISSETERYATWFGVYDDSRKATVLDHFENISDKDFSSFTYNCTCTDADTYAYVYPEDFGTIYLCGAFWKAPLTGANSKAGTLVHESSHFTVNGGTEDHAYGEKNCMQLAKDDPAQAITNADNHEYFAENDPELD